MKQAHSCLISDADQISSRSPFHLRAGICLTTHTHIQPIPATFSKIMTLLPSRHRYAAVHEAAKAKAGNKWENGAEGQPSCLPNDRLISCKAVMSLGLEVEVFLRKLPVLSTPLKSKWKSQPGPSPRLTDGVTKREICGACLLHDIASWV
jgi:hypothetical protein